MSRLARELPDVTTFRQANGRLSRHSLFCFGSGFGYAEIVPALETLAGKHRFSGAFSVPFTVQAIIS